MFDLLARHKVRFWFATSALLSALVVGGCSETSSDDGPAPSTTSGHGGGGPVTAQASTGAATTTSTSSAGGAGGAGTGGGNGGSSSGGSGGQSSEDAAVHGDASDAGSVDEKPASADAPAGNDARGGDAASEASTASDGAADAAPPADGGKAVPQQGLILHLGLDDNPPTTALDEATGTKGMAQNCMSVPGKMGLAFRFAGTNPMNPAMSSLIQFPDRPALNPTNAITVAAWIRPRTGDMGGGPRILQKGYDNSDQDTQYRFIINGNSIALLLFNQGNTAAISGPLPPLNEWHHVAITWDSVSGTGIVYVDGVNKKQTTYRGAIGVSAMPLFIGTKHDNDKVTNWDGDLDEIVLYNRALTVTEVQQLAAP